MKIGVLGNIQKEVIANTIDEFIAFFQDLGYETVKFLKPTEIRNVDVVVVLGGDGAILHTSVLAAKKEVKIIGVNYGNVGFLTEFEKDEREELAQLLQDVENGTNRVIKRSLLQLNISGKSFYALNEVAIQRDYGFLRPDATQILKLQVDTPEGQNIIAGDGALFCTPTGSTAYSLSAGGAILTPEVPVVMMTPICAFSTRVRPTVFSDNTCFSVKSLKGKAILQIDGRTVTALPEGAEITIEKAPFTADFPVRENSDFFARVKNKLNG